MNTILSPSPNPSHAEHRWTLDAVLAKQCRERGAKTAIRGVFGDISYETLYASAARIADGLAAKGVSPGDPVLLMCGNTLDHILGWLGIVFAGAVEVPVNTSYVGSMLEHVVNDSGARAAIVEASFMERLEGLEDHLPALKLIFVCGQQLQGRPHTGRWERSPFADLMHPERAQRVAPRKPRDMMAIMYTSGTTGPAKGVCITQAHAHRHCLPGGTGGPCETDVVLVSLPLFHIGGQWNGVYQAWIMGATAALLEKFSATRFWEDARALGATYTTLLGAQASFLMAQPRSDADRLHTIRRVSMLPLIEDVPGFQARFGIEGVRTGYGTSEGGSPIGADFNTASPKACGWLKPGYQARLVDEDDMEVPRGSPGELVLRTDEPWTLMQGYLGLPDKTQEAFRNLWLHTGDMFRQDEGGQFFFLDRNKDSIRRRGENISSFEVEREVCAHEAVAESAAVAVPSPHTEDELMVFVVLRPGHHLDAADLLAFVAGRAPRHMVPRYVEFVEDLPRTPTNRVQKHVLRARGPGVHTWDQLEQDRQAG